MCETDCCKVTANHLETGLTRTTTSDEEGRFVFPGLPVGLYELRAEFAGFEPLVFANVRLTVNDTTAISLVMKVSSLSAIPYPRIQMGKRKPTDPPLEGRADYLCTVVLPQDIRIRIETTGKGVLLGQEFSGEFDASFFFFGLVPTMTIGGYFTINLA